MRRRADRMVGRICDDDNDNDVGMDRMGYVCGRALVNFDLLSWMVETRVDRLDNCVVSG